MIGDSACGHSRKALCPSGCIRLRQVTVAGSFSSRPFTPPAPVMCGHAKSNPGLAGVPQSAVPSLAGLADLLLVDYHFVCKHCGTQFVLGAETYHGSGGYWSPENEKPYATYDEISSLVAKTSCCGLLWAKGGRGQLHPLLNKGEQVRPA